MHKIIPIQLNGEKKMDEFMDKEVLKILKQGVREQTLVLILGITSFLLYFVIITKSTN